jgi:hypothetical protein
MVGLLAMFYGTGKKSLAISFMRINPSFAILQWLTQNVRMMFRTARLYDFNLVVIMGAQGCVIGGTIDLIRWLRHPKRG